MVGMPARQDAARAGLLSRRAPANGRLDDAGAFRRPRPWIMPRRPLGLPRAVRGDATTSRRTLSNGVGAAQWGHPLRASHGPHGRLPHGLSGRLAVARLGVALYSALARGVAAPHRLPCWRLRRGIMKRPPGPEEHPHSIGGALLRRALASQRALLERQGDGPRAAQITRGQSGPARRVVSDELRQGQDLNPLLGVTPSHC